MIHSMDMSEFQEIKPKMSFIRRFFRYFCILFFLLFGIIAVLLIVSLVRAVSVKPVFEVDAIFDGNFSFPNERLEYMTSLFAESLRFKTVSRAPHDYDHGELLRMQTFLKQKFGLVFNSSFIKWETVNNYSLLFTIQGSEKTLSPYLLASHMDVVPVQEDQWNFDPFLGQIIHDPQTGEEVVWGRGAIDVKSGVMGILSAMEFLVDSGWRPKRSFFIAFGHDEEVGGNDGAGQIAQILEKRGVKIDFIIDEGMPITKGIIQGIDTAVAVIGVSEKGWLNVKLVAEGTSGHSSIPPKNQAINTLSKAISSLYDNPQPSMYGSGLEYDMLRYLAYKANWPYKLAFANQWLFGPYINYVFSQSRESNALIRTTTAVTMYNGGIKINVVPSKATAIINHRVHPAQNLQNVIDHDISVISDDNVEVTMLEGIEAHPISSYGPNSPPFRLLSSVINHIDPTIVTIPGILMANTDLKHYMNLTNDMYRIIPSILNKAGVAMIHSINERLSVTNFHHIIKFFLFLIKNADNYEVYQTLSIKQPREL